MLPLDDPRWAELEGGYRRPYDARPLIGRFRAGEEAWAEVWDELHHQGDIGLASYAVLPHLVEIFRGRARDWQLYHYAAVLEECRHGPARNPGPPNWLGDDYDRARDALLDMAVEDIRDRPGNPAVLCIAAFIAGFGGKPGLSAAIGALDCCEDAMAILRDYGETLDG